ncbi:phthiocerol type I polyketide synthase PpsA [soil metagenome]
MTHDLHSHTGPAPEPIAIIGIGCRLAGNVTTPADLWTFLLESRSAVREVPAQRWEPYLHRDPRNAAILKATTPWGTFLDNLPAFDAEFFGVSPREAELMDPQQRLAVEVCWEALEHAGVPPRSVAGTDTAVLMGVNSDDYGKLLMEDLAGIEAWTGIGTSLCGVANRVSHLLDLRGPSVALDAACAASLVAVHQACQLLRDGETSLALAGGVSALIGPGLTRVLDIAGATAPDGRCKTFDAAADGYGRGEGAAVVVLKRLADAERDHDRVLAVVRGGAVAQDGRTVGIMSPNGEAQAEMFRRACRVSHVPPGSVDFIEAHGTGTPTGDPVELNALAAVYGAARPREKPCAVGSIKPNTGHLEGAAGVVGLIKAALALHHQVIPPTAGVRTLTPAVQWATSGLRVPTTAQTWARRDHNPRRAAVCSYGYGGTIAHVLLEEAPPAKPASSPAKVAAPAIIALSARSEARLARQAEALAVHLRTDDHPLDRVANTLWTRRSHETVRAAVVADGREDLLAGLEALAVDARDAGVVRGSVVPGADKGAVWVFSGHGSHWAGMGSELLDAEPKFAEIIDTIDPVFRAELGFSPRQALSAGELGGTDQVQALTFAVQVGLAAVLCDRGVRPAAVIGHSVGEVAACVVAGVLTLEHGAAVACFRARGFRSVMGQGAMALVGLPFHQAEHRLLGRADVVAAISSSPLSTVISGDVDGVVGVSALLADQGVMVRRVATDVAFHSPAMDSLTGELARLTGGLPPARDAGVALYTTALADPRSRAPRDPDYWVANLRGRVRFAEAVTAAAEDGHRLFLEVSAHPVGAHSIAETLAHNGFDDSAVIPVLRRDQPQVRALSTAVAALYCHGAPVAVPTGQWADDLPGTQWHHRDFWRTPTPPPGGRTAHDVDSHTLLGGPMDVTGAVPARIWQTRVDMDTRPYPGNHPVQGTEIVPAAVLLNTFLTAAGTDLADVRLRTPVAPGRVRDVQVVLQDRALSLATQLAGDDEGGWLTHCTAVSARHEKFESTTVVPKCPESLPPNHVVYTLAGLGVAEMGFDWQILDLRRGDGELLARVAAEADGSAPTTWAGLLDAATSVASTVFDGPPRLRMPARLDRVHVQGAPPAVGVIHVSRRAGTTTTDVTIADASGAVLVRLAGMGFEELENPGGADITRMVHDVAWHPKSFVDSARPTEVALVGGDAETLAVVVRDLAAVNVAYRVFAEPDQLPAGLGNGAVVLVLPRAGDTAEASVELVRRTLTDMHTAGSQARMWVLTQRVYDGDNLGHAPLWGLARVAAAEHPRLWGGVLDLADARIPLGALVSLPGHGVVVVRGGTAYTARLAFAAAGTGTSLSCSPGATYLITGGTGVLGLRMAQRLADLGARRLVLVSRSGLPTRADWSADSEVVRVVSALEHRGISVRVAAVDIGAADGADALRHALRDLPPVRGVVHAAGVEAGALLVDTTADHVAATMRPKAAGAENLHQVFPPGQLDWMVLFSSCGYLAGFPGQGAYACANAYLDTFAQYRRNLGDRTTSVAFTAWRGLGMGSGSGFVAAQLEDLGMDTVGADDALRALDVAVQTDRAHVVVLPVLPGAAGVPMLADVAPCAATESEVTVGPVGPGDADTAEWAAQQVLAAVAAELGLPEDGVDPRRPLVEIGVDSIMTVAVRRQLEKHTGLSLPPTLLWEHPTAAAVTARIVELLDAQAAKEPAEVS